MRAYHSLQFDRPVDTKKHYLSPGGYEVEVNGDTYQFDFLETSGNVDNTDPTIVHFLLKELDTDTFPESEEFRAHIHEITKLCECYCYTGEYDDPPINCIRIVSFTIIDYGNGKREPKSSTPFVDVECFNTESYWEFTYRFTDKLLKTCPMDTPVREPYQNSITISFTSHNNGTYNVDISTEGNSGFHYENVSAIQIGETVSDFIDTLEEGANGKSYIHKPPLSSPDKRRIYEELSREYFISDFIARVEEKKDDDPDSCNIPDDLENHPDILDAAYQMYQERKDCNIAYNDTVDSIINTVNKQY